ncbi:MAG: DNA-binding protein Alba [Candidatus Bathyarchaeia archaeon]
MSNNESIFIGSKPIMSYVTAVITALRKADEVKVLARGRAITNAVDVVELTKRNFMTDIIVNSISIGTEKISQGNNVRNVSTIEITLSKKKS